jgi:hypothetical protein
MSRVFPSLPRPTVWWLVACLLACLAPAPAWGSELKLRSQLIWGTNDPKPGDGKCGDVDPAIRERLSRVFKWQNYYLVKSLEVTVTPGETPRARMSEKCELEFKLVDDFTLEIKLFGEGKLVKTVRQSLQALRQGELAVLAGDSKEKFGDAWFVVISQPRK